MALFGTNKQSGIHQRLPVAYNKPIWVDKQMFGGIELVSKIENLSKKEAAHLLREEEFKKYKGKEVREVIHWHNNIWLLVTLNNNRESQV
jgi:hypothetical protein